MEILELLNKICKENGINMEELSKLDLQDLIGKLVQGDGAKANGVNDIMAKLGQSGLNLDALNKLDLQDLIGKFSQGNGLKADGLNDIMSKLGKEGLNLDALNKIELPDALTNMIKKDDK